MIFVFTIWGDIAEGRKSEKIYAWDSCLIYFSTFIRYSLGGTTISSTLFNDLARFSLFSVSFLFVAVLPLVFAPETLSEQTIKNNELKNYVDKAQKKVATVQEKKIRPVEKVDSKAESPKESDEYKKAQELAEKYY